MAPTTNLEMQFDSIGPRTAHFGDCLPDLDLLTFLNQQAAIMGIRAKVCFIMFDDDHVPIAQQTTARVDHGTVCRCFDRLTQLPGNINPFIQTAVRLKP